MVQRHSSDVGIRFLDHPVAECVLELQLRNISYIKIDTAVALGSSTMYGMVPSVI